MAPGRPALTDAAHAAELDPFLGGLTGSHLTVRPPGGYLHQPRIEDVQALEPLCDVLLLAYAAPVPLRRLVHEVGDEVADLGILADQLTHHHAAAGSELFGDTAHHSRRTIGV